MDQVLILEALRDYPMRIPKFFDNGQPLLAALTRHRPDLIVLDIHMPGIDGIETLERIRKAASDIPVMVFSGTEDKDEIAICRQLGVLDVVQKPNSFSAFREAVRQIMSLRKPIPQSV